MSQQMMETLGKKLVQLKCHLHTLDGMATQARKELKTLDVEWENEGNVFGSKGCTANLVYAASKLKDVKQ